MPTMNATDLHGALSSSFCPAILARPDILSDVITDVAIMLAQHKVTEKRFMKAALASGLHIPDTVLRQVCRELEMARRIKW
jgi:hypothetical protein